VASIARNPVTLMGRASKSFRFAAEPSEDTNTDPGLAVVGVDPGDAGALALASRDGDLIAVVDMPTLRDGSGRRVSVNASLLAKLLARWHAREVISEFVSARPKEGAVGAFSFRRSRGLIKGGCALNLPIRFRTSSAWKRLVGLPSGRDGAKDAARSEAIRRWPAKAALFAGAKDDGRAEAALIAAAGLLREGKQ
jgi:crossover junction endodeoxyribonuclease RuvC